MDIVKKVDKGVKLLNELMVDIIGAAIPGFLSLIVIFVSVVLPALAICNDRGTIINASEPISSGFWWVLLIVCIIVSYCIGHIFYRSDIVKVDKRDIDRYIKEFVHSVCRKHYSDEELWQILLRDIQIINQNLKKCNQINGLCADKLKDSSNLIIERVKSNQKTNIVGPLLYLLFPEDFENDIDIDEITYESLTRESKNIIIEYRKLFHAFHCSYYEKKGMEGIVICYCILHMQMDAGCASKTRCDFPYINYYKYLLKRGMTELISHVDWMTIEGRTKNKINEKKIQIQIFAPEAYALMNKNESHIRMSSSTWHTTDPLLLITGCMTMIMFMWCVLDYKQSGMCTCCMIHPYVFSLQRIIVCALPCLMFCAVFFIRRRIIRYIHYQRLREIQYVLQVYNQYKDVIGYRKDVLSGNRYELNIIG